MYLKLFVNSFFDNLFKMLLNPYFIGGSMENILDRIKTLVAQKEITIAELERRTDIGNGVIRRWGSSLPTGDKLQRVAKYLGVTIDYLVNGKDEENAKATILARNAKGLTEEQIDLLNNMIKQMKK